MQRKHFRSLLGLIALLLGAPGVAAQAEPLRPVCLQATGVRDLVNFDEQLTGQTVSIALVELSQQAAADAAGYDFMPNFLHQAFHGVNQRMFYYYRNPHRPALFSAHASVVAGVLFGYAETDDVIYRGVVPQATVDLYEANWFIYKRVLAATPEPMAVDVVNISWGTDADDPVTRWWQRGIDALADTDGLVMVAGCGNGADEFHSITKPSCGYNVISVGAARSLGEHPDCLSYVGPPVTELSSFGPTEDDRCKPDVIAPGLCLAPTADSLTGYAYDSSKAGYSSFAAPQVAGIAALLIDAARQYDIAAGDDPRLVKALILNGAHKLIGWHKGSCDPADDHQAPLDYRQGAGLINVWNSYWQLLAGRYEHDPWRNNRGWDMGRIQVGTDDPNSQQVYYLPQLLPAGSEFKATLCWNRHYQSDRLYSPLPLNKLALELWSVNDQGQLLTRLDYSASPIDNVQHIYYHNQAAQKVALIVSNLSPDPNSPSFLSLDPNDLPHETYALAYCSDQENWSGDQMAADLNADGTVDELDVIQLLNTWYQHKQDPWLAERQRQAVVMPEDINVDGNVDQQDFQLLSPQWKKTSPWHRPRN